MSDRSSNPSFAVSRNLKNAKYHFIEAKVDKLTESSDIINSDTTQVSSDTWNSVSSSTWLCATSNTESTSRKTWQTSLLFLEPLQVQNLKRKSGGDMAYYVPQIKKWRGHVPRVPHQIAPIPTSRMKRETNDASKSQVNQASWNRLVLKFDSGNQLGIHNYLWIVFFVIFPWSHDLVKSRHYQFDWVCAAHLENRSLLLKSVRITGIWIRENWCWQKKQVLKN